MGPAFLNRLLATAALAASCAMPGPGPLRAQETAPGAATLDLPAALARVLDANLDLRRAEEALVAAEAELERRRAGLLPTVDLNASQSRSRSVGAGGASTGNRFGASLDADLALADATRLSSHRLARYRRELASLDRDDLREELLAAAARAYFGHRRDLARLDVIDAALARDRVLIDLARAQVEAGVATPIDVTRAEAREARNRQDRLQQETEVLASRLALLRLLDLPAASPLALAPVAAPAPSPALADPSPEALAAARADLRAADLRVERNAYARRAAGWQRLPSVDLFASAGLAGEAAFDGSEDDTWSAGIRFSVPVFDGRAIRADVREATSALRDAELARADLRAELAAGLVLARRDLDARWDQIALARRTVDLGREELRLARTRFQEGVADNRDVVEAQASLAEAEDLLVNAEYRYQLARVTLARLKGDVRAHLAP